MPDLITTILLSIGAAIVAWAIISHRKRHAEEMERARKAAELYRQINQGAQMFQPKMMTPEERSAEARRRGL